MSEIAKIQTQISVDEQNMMAVLRSSLYPGASDSSIKMVLAYCQAANLDPLQKPCHIVPMYNRNAGGMIDVIMPGIGLYRIQAARTGEYAGMSPPAFGDDISETIGTTAITYPSSCSITVLRLLKGGGDPAEFTATEYWKENYAQKGGREKLVDPNAMWLKRPYGQLAKCAEAQALRKAFPEIGSQPTAEELEGKHQEAEPEKAAVEYTLLPDYPEDKFDTNFGVWESMVLTDGKSPETIINMVSTRYSLSDDQLNKIRKIGENDNADA